MSAAAAEHREPASEVHKEPVERGGPNKYLFTTLFLTLCVLLFVTITTVTGQWAKPDGSSGTGALVQVDLWSSCSCTDNDDIPCDNHRRLFRNAAGWSVIAVGSQWLSIILFGVIFANIGKGFKGARIAGIVFAWLATIALIISWATFAGLYNQRYCGFRLKDMGGDLNWSFALRICETALWIIVSILFTMVNGRPETDRRGFLRAAIFLAIFTFGITVATTAGRGWIYSGNNHNPRGEMSLWETCSCTLSKHFPCNEERRLFRNQQAWSIMSVFFTFFLLFFIVFELPRGIHVFMSFLVLISIIITWATFAGWFNKSHCGVPEPDTFFRLDWPFGLNVVASIFQFFVFIITIVGAAGKC
jgi:hypothetical protein